MKRHDLPEIEAARFAPPPATHEDGQVMLDLLTHAYNIRYAPEELVDDIPDIEIEEATQ